MVFGFRDGKGTALVRWDLASNRFEPLALVPHAISKLGVNEDATRIGALVADRVMLFDGNGALQLERALEDDDEGATRGRIETFVVEADAISLHFHCDDEDHPELFSLARVTSDRVIWEDSVSRPAWFRHSDASKEYGDRALGMVAISHDGTRIAPARAAWTRPAGVALEVPAIYDSGMSSSWGGEASVDSLVFDAAGELLCDVRR